MITQKFETLKETIQDLEMLKDVNDELQENHIAYELDLLHEIGIFVLIIRLQRFTFARVSTPKYTASRNQ